MMNAEQITEAERKTFEQDAEALGFSTVRLVNCNPEPWDDYLEHNTGSFASSRWQQLANGYWQKMKRRHGSRY